MLFLRQDDGVWNLPEGILGRDDLQGGARRVIIEHVTCDVCKQRIEEYDTCYSVSIVRRYNGELKRYELCAYCVRKLPGELHGAIR